MKTLFEKLTADEKKQIAAFVDRAETWLFGARLITEEGGQRFEEGCSDLDDAIAELESARTILEDADMRDD